MPKNRPLETSCPESIEAAFDAHDEVGMLRAMVKKYARVLDMTDSGRDIKPLSTGLLEIYDRLAAVEAANADAGKAPLFAILEEAAKSA